MLFKWNKLVSQVRGKSERISNEMKYDRNSLAILKKVLSSYASELGMQLYYHGNQQTPNIVVEAKSENDYNQDSNGDSSFVVHDSNQEL